MQKVLIIGDAERISNRIEAVLSPHDFKIFLSHNVKDGLKIARRYIPDLIIYSSSGEDETSIIKKIGSDEILALIPLLIITENFSIEKQRTAIELGADDYIPEAFIERTLLKSIDARFLKLSRIKQKIHSSINNFDEQENGSGNDDHILIKIGNKLKLIEFSEIVCITALKEYSRLITKENYKIIVRKSLKAWVKLLPSGSFLRIHRATIININYIEEITRTNERIYTVHLKYIKDTFDFSYRYANLMRHTFPT